MQSTSRLHSPQRLITSFSDYSVEQLSLDLLPPSSFDTLISGKGIDNLAIVINNRLKNNWHVKIHRHNNTRDLHIPPCLKHAPVEIKNALISWAQLPFRKRGRYSNELRRDYELKIRSFIESSISSADKRYTPEQKWSTRGVRYDLKEVFDSVNRQFFASTLSAYLRWGKEGSRTSYQSTRRDTLGKPWYIITIAGIYNQPDIPRFAIEAIMFHEMLHIHIPPKRVNGRNVIHGKDFKAFERTFPHYKQWIEWEKTILSSLVVRRKKRKRFRFF